jgi:hypothetical protein
MFTALLRVGLAIGLATTATATDKPEGKRLVITNKPLTLSVESTPKTQESLAAATKPGSKVAVTLALKGVVPPERRDQVEGIRVFLNKDDATQDTSTDDPHFVTVFAFSSTDQREPYGVNLDLTRAVIGLSKKSELDTTKPLRITLVAVPASGLKNLPAAFSVPVGTVSIETSQVK